MKETRKKACITESCPRFAWTRSGLCQSCFLAQNPNNRRKKKAISCEHVMPYGNLCGLPVRCSKLCATHYEQARKSGKIGAGPKDCVAPIDEKGTPCGHNVVGYGYCGAHLARYKKTGDVGNTPVLQRIERDGCLFVDSVTGEKCDRDHNSGGYCYVHAQHIAKWGEARPIRKMNKHGEGSINQDGYRVVYKPGHPNVENKLGTILEHRWLMSESLGRPLSSNENVHHKNGNRLDNRIIKGHELKCPSTCCNLELWDTSQPPGQRVSDKVAWCKQYLDEHSENSDDHYW